VYINVIYICIDKKSKNFSVNFFTIQNKCTIFAAVKKGLSSKGGAFWSCQDGVAPLCEQENNRFRLKEVKQLNN